MNRAAASTVIPARREPTIAPIARALVWEECRVGGVVAAVCTAVAILLSVSTLITVGPQGWERPEGLLEFAVLFLPFLLGLLLVLNTANSGHLISGFSRRILWLPVSVPMAVAITLGLRTLFMGMSGFAIIAVSRILFDNGPSFTLVALFVTAYLVVQTLDWLRAAVSGLSSALVLSAVISLPFLVLYIKAIMMPVHWAGAANPVTAFAIAMTAFAVAYGLSVMAVQATRVGRRTGIPEIWEWPQLLERKGRARLRPFDSPVTAQVWFEVRRYGWVLPVGTAMLVVVMVLLAILLEGGLQADAMRVIAAYGIPIALLMAAMMHGVAARSVDVLAARGKPGYQFVLALSSADGALARCLANAIVLIPMVIFAATLHTWILVGGFLAEVVPGALEIGAVSAREVVWLVISRGLVLALVAWALMGVSSLWMGILIPGLIAYVAGLAYFERTYLLPVTSPPPIDPTSAFPLYFLALPLITLAAFVLSWWRGWIPPRMLAAWAGIWLLAAWLMHRAVPAHGFEGWAALYELHVKALGGLSWGALVVLPFLLLTLDITRKRHGSPWSRQSGLGSQSPRPRRPGAWASATAAALFIIWLGWPAEPAYRAALRAEGAPMTYEALDAYYPAVPDEANRALPFLAAIERYQTRTQAFHDENQRHGIELQAEIMEMISQGVGGRPDAVGPEGWARLEEYWLAITRHTAPELIALVQENPYPARYHIDLREGPNTLLPHLAPLRQLCRELAIDALYHAAKGDTDRALASVHAIIPIGETLREEPVIISQLVRMACARIGLRAIESMLEHAEWDDGGLRLVDDLLLQLAAPFEGDTIMRRSLIAERSMYALDHRKVPAENSQDEPSWELLGPVVIARALTQPPEAERMVLMTGFAEIARTVEETGSGFPVEPRRRGQDFSDKMVLLRNAAPVATAMVSNSATIHMAEAMLRMEFAIARTAIAAERYRRAHGDWPGTLDALVPNYVDAVPYDVCADPPRQPIRHAVRDDGAFVVYSVGMSGTDHGGNPRTVDDRDTDDRVFQVPAPRREGASHE